MKNRITGQLWLMMTFGFILITMSSYAQWQYGGPGIWSSYKVAIGAPAGSDNFNVFGTSSFNGATKFYNTVTWQTGSTLTSYGNAYFYTSSPVSFYTGISINGGTNTFSGTLNFNSDISLIGAKKLNFSSYGGGFYMSDATWIRTAGNKSFYHNTGTMRTDGRFQVGSGGSRFHVTTNGNTGIGVSSPSFKLDVGGDIRTSGWIRSSGDYGLYNTTDGTYFYSDDGNYFKMRSNYGLRIANKSGSLKGYLYHNNSNGFGFVDRDGSWVIRLEHDSYTSFSINASEKMRILSSGNVGIGTTSPVHKLDVNGSVNATSFLLNGQPFTGGSSIDGITSLNGNIGIGTTNPLWKLDVNGNARFFESLEVYGGNAVTLGSDFVGGEAGLIGPNDDFIAVFYEDGSYRFGQPGGTNTGITIRNGNVGINTTTPGYPFDVHGSMRVGVGNSDNIFIGEGGVFYGDVGDVPLVKYNATSNSLSYGDNDALVILENGNIGIKNTNPTASLHLKPDGGNLYTGIRVDHPYENIPIYLTAFEDGNGLFDDEELPIATTEASQGGYNIYRYAAGNLYFDEEGDANFGGTVKASTVDVSNFLLNGQPFSGGEGITGITSLNGKIGINESNPQQVLHVNGKIRTQALGEEYYLEIGGDVENLGLKHSHSGDIISADDATGITIGNPSTTQILTRGKILLSDGTNIIKFGNDQYDYDFAIKASDPNHGNIVYYNPQGEFTFANNALKFSGNELKNARFYGKVGIGTYALDDYGLNLSGKLRISDPQEALPLVLGVSGAGQDPFWGLFVEDKTLIASEATSVFYIANNTITVNAESTTPLTKINGKVLINKTSQVNSNYKLDVNGDVRANEIVVNTTGADFVFEDDYTLRSLEEVEEFVDKNNHLPEIPSAKEMQENGVAVGDLNTKLLQKIEELTLYMIELKKENDSLKERLEEVEQKVVNSKN